MSGILSVTLHQSLAKYYQYTVRAMKNGVFFEWKTEPDIDVVSAHEIMMEEVDAFMRGD